MLQIRPVNKVLVVATLVVALLLPGALRPAPAAADSSLSTPAIIAIAFGAYLVVVVTVTTIIYYRRERQREKNRPQPTQDPYSFTSNRLRPPTSNDGLQFGSKCAAHGPGTLFCW